MLQEMTISTVFTASETATQFTQHLNNLQVFMNLFFNLIGFNLCGGECSSLGHFVLIEVSSKINVH